MLTGICTKVKRTFNICPCQKTIFVCLARNLKVKTCHQGGWTSYQSIFEKNVTEDNPPPKTPESEKNYLPKIPRKCCTIQEVKDRPEIILWYFANMISYLGFFMPFLNLVSQKYRIPFSLAVSERGRRKVIFFSYLVKFFLCANCWVGTPILMKHLETLHINI